MIKLKSNDRASISVQRKVHQCAGQKDNRLAQGANLQLVTIVMLDGGGNLVTAEREDGCAPLRFPMAKGKAYASLFVGVASSVLGERNTERTTFVASVAAASLCHFVAVASGVHILNEHNRMIGSAVFSGALSHEDQQIAIAGIEFVGFT